MIEMGNVGHIFLHIVILFIVALIVVRLMGSRTVGQLSPFDFIIMVGIGDIIVTASMDKGQSIFTGIEGLATLLVLQQLLSYSALKSITLRKWFEGTPVTLIQDGKIIPENFVKTNFNYDDLRQELHRQGMDMTDLADIKFARLESCGTFSVIKIPEMEPLTKRDLDIYLQNIAANPLSSLGKQWSSVEKYMAEVHELVEHLKSQGLIDQVNNYTEVQHTKELR